MRTIEQVLALCREDGDCLIWQGSKNSKGHPKVNQMSGRRWMWAHYKGPIPPGMFVSIECECVGCLNVDHMVLRTKGEISRLSHARPATKRKQSVSGARGMAHRAKLDAEKARYIRHSDKLQSELAQELGISQALVSRVRLHRAWKDAANPFAGLV